MLSLGDVTMLGAMWENSALTNRMYLDRQDTVFLQALMLKPALSQKLLLNPTYVQLVFCRGHG